jgi:hypothetical protein
MFIEQYKNSRRVLCLSNYVLLIYEDTQEYIWLEEGPRRGTRVWGASPGVHPPPLGRGTPPPTMHMYALITPRLGTL